MVDRDPVVEALLEGFAAEARQICQRITNNVLELEHADDLAEDARRAHYEELARGLHTLKGNSDTFGFPQLADLSHKLEDVVALYRPSLAALPNTMTDLLLRGLDVFVARLASRGQGPEPPGLEELLTALKAAKQGKIVKPAGAPARRRREQVTEPPIEEPIESTLEDWRIGPQHVESMMREIERMRELRLRLDEQKRDVERGLRALHKVRAAEVLDVRDLLKNLSRSLGADSDETGDIVDSLEQELKTI